MPATAVPPELDLPPHVAKLYDDLLARLWDGTGFDPIVLELCRLRQARLLGCEAETARRTQDAVDAGLDEEVVAALSSWPTSPDFDQRTRACLAYTEAFVIDPHGVDDTTAAAVRDHVGEPGLVALTMALGLFDGVCRVRLSLEVT